MAQEKNKEFIPYKTVLKILQELSVSDNSYTFSQGNIITVTENDSEVIQSIILSPVFPAFEEDEILSSYLSRIPSEPPSQLIILIQAGAAALGFFHQEKMLHKVITKYMVRKGQGKAQLTYANTKGKSRMGSRIRLQQGLLFFKEINEKLHHWKNEVSAAEKIYVSCPIRLMNELYGGKTFPPFPRKDERIRKVPFSMHKPSFKELKRIHFLLNSSIIT